MVREILPTHCLSRTKTCDNTFKSPAIGNSAEPPGRKSFLPVRSGGYSLNQLTSFVALLRGIQNAVDRNLHSYRAKLKVSGRRKYIQLTLVRLLVANTYLTAE